MPRANRASSAVRAIVMAACLARFDPGADRLWFAGDLVNRGPKSLETLRFIRDLGETAVSVLGNHALHLLAAAHGHPIDHDDHTLDAILAAPDRDELIDWLRFLPLAHYDRSLDTLLVHAGVHPDWTLKKTLKNAAEVEAALQDKKYRSLLGKMYGNTPRRWSDELSGHKRLRFTINCLTRMRMLTPKGGLNFAHSGSPYRGNRNLVPWFSRNDRAIGDTRIVFGHWSALGLMVLPNLISVDTGCVWGRQLTAVRIDKQKPRVIQVPGQTD